MVKAHRENAARPTFGQLPIESAESRYFDAVAPFKSPIYLLLFRAGAADFAC